MKLYICGPMSGMPGSNYPAFREAAKTLKASGYLVADPIRHEVDDPERLFGELHDVLKPGGRVLLAEPALHVSEAAFERSAAHARAAGFSECGRPAVSCCRAAVFAKGAPDADEPDGIRPTE